MDVLEEPQEVIGDTGGEMENDQQVDSQDENDPINRIPNEVWVLILSQLNQKELVQARTVWKKFLEVVDAHFEFSLILHDGKTDLDRVYQLRIKDCLITRLLGDKDIFQYPSLIRRLRFWGPINPLSFQRIMKQATALEQVSLTKFALMQENLMAKKNLKGFTKVKKLELLGYICKDESKVVAKNTTAIFKYLMTDLEKLTVNFHCDINSINDITKSLMLFISRHQQLQNLIVSLIPEANHPNEATSTAAPVPEDVQQALRSVQLNILRITTATKDLGVWTTLLNSQTRLQDLRMLLNEGGIVAVNNNYTVGILFDLVKEPLIRNASTLTSVELKDLRLTPAADGSLHPPFVPLDANVFRFASNLKKLILYRNTDDYRRSHNPPSIINLKMIPASVEILEISRFLCSSEDLQYLVDVLENLKTILLSQTGSLPGLGVHGGIVESISLKTEIQTMNISPLNFCCPEENKKYDAVKLKYQMNDGDHLYYDFERYRNGMPQPKPPHSDGTSYGPRQFRSSPERCGAERRALRRAIRIRRERQMGIRGRCDPIRRFEAMCEMNAGRFRWESEFHFYDDFGCSLESIPSLFPGPSGACCSERMPSRALDGLNLQVSSSQKNMFRMLHCTRGGEERASRRRGRSLCLESRKTPDS